jgi:hypothetical protein
MQPKVGRANFEISKAQKYYIVLAAFSVNEFYNVNNNNLDLFSLNKKLA